MDTELELFTYLKTNHYPDLSKSDNQYSTFDCKSLLSNEYIELKCRKIHYNELMIEKSKYERILKLSNTNRFQPVYINSTPSGIYKFYLTKQKIDWENKLCPTTTQFGNIDKIIKEIGLISIQNSLILHTFKNQITMENEKKFADGFIFKRNEKAPDFVIGNLSIKTAEAIQFLQQNDKKGWVNLSIKTSKAGKHYIELDTYEPKKEEVVENLPF